MNSGDSSPTSQEETPLSAPLRKRFALSGHSAKIDPTRDAVRDDLADVELADRVFAPHYAAAITYVATEEVRVHARADPSSAQLDQLEAGSPLDLFDLSAGWAWVRTAKAVGYVVASAIKPA